MSVITLMNFAFNIAECFTQEWAMGLIPCFTEKFEPLLDLIPMASLGTGSSRSLQSTKTKDRPARMNKWYRMMHGMIEVHDEYQSALLDALGGRRPHTKEEKEKERIAKKLLKLNTGFLKEEYVNQLMGVSLELQDRMDMLADIYLTKEQAASFKIGQYTEIGDLCRSLGGLIGIPVEVCDQLDNILICLGDYNETDFEDHLKWVKCLYECR